MERSALAQLLRFLAVALFTAVILDSAKSAPPNTTSAMHLMSYCEEVVKSRVGPDSRVDMDYNFQSGLCFGAFLAFHSLSFAYDVVKDSPNGTQNKYKRILPVCAPQGVSLIQMVRIFDSYARQHPEIQHEPFDVVVLNALESAFPCR